MKARLMFYPLLTILLLGVLYSLTGPTITGMAVGDLKSFDELFIEDGQVEALVVIGNDSTAQSAIGQLKLINFFSGYNRSKNIAALASEVGDIYKTNIISIGNPCINEVTKKIMDYKGSCNFDKGLVRLYEKNGKHQLVIYGVGAGSTAKAIDDLVYLKLSGAEVAVEPEKGEISEKGGIKAVGENKEAVIVPKQDINYLKNDSLNTDAALAHDAIDKQASIKAITEMLSPTAKDAARLVWILLACFIIFVFFSVLIDLYLKDKIKKNKHKNISYGMKLPKIPIRKTLPPISSFGVGRGIRQDVEVPAGNIMSGGSGGTPRDVHKKVINSGYDKVSKGAFNDDIIWESSKGRNKAVPEEAKALLDSVGRLKLLVEEKKRLKSRKELMNVKTEIERLKELVEIERQKQDIFQKIEAIEKS